MYNHAYTKDGKPMCALPPITKHWRRLGTGATWTCSCGIQKRIIRIASMDGYMWSWDGA